MSLPWISAVRRGRDGGVPVAVVGRVSERLGHEKPGRAARTIMHPRKTEH